MLEGVSGGVGHGEYNDNFILDVILTPLFHGKGQDNFNSICDLKAFSADNFSSRGPILR